MIKIESDLEDLHSVDPHLIQPLEQPTFDDLLTERNSESNSLSPPPQEFQDETQLPPDCDELRMEHCINLDLYLTPIPDTMANCFTDELNTPDIFVASKGLNKIINNTTAHQQQSDGNPFTFPETKQTDDEVESTNSQQNQSSIMNPNAMISNNFEINLFRAFQSNQTIDNSTINLDTDSSTLLSPNMFDDINLDEYDFLTDYPDAIINDDMNNNDMQAAADEEDNVLQPTVTTINDQHNYALKLHIDGKLFETDDLQTPDVINTICSIENDFKFFQGKYLSPEQIKKELAAEEESPAAQHSEPESIEPEDSMQSIASELKAAKRSRRRKHDTDDEDYVPPTKQRSKKTTKRRTVKAAAPVATSDEDDEEEDERQGTYTPAKIPKRGRPSKPVSRASDSSECSKYREMRDKNNEASRRSRRKRRVQEQTFEVECEELVSHNERLRVQVAELEKSVSTYRNNLMTILLSRK